MNAKHEKWIGIGILVFCVIGVLVALAWLPKTSRKSKTAPAVDAATKQNMSQNFASGNGNNNIDAARAVKNNTCPSCQGKK